MSIKVIGKPASHVELTVVPSTFRRLGNQLYKWDESKQCYVWVFSANSKNSIVLEALYSAACEDK